MRSPQPLHRIRVFVADSSAIHSELLAGAIARDHSFDVVGSAANSNGIDRLVRTTNTDVLLISASSSDQSTGGLGILAKMRASFPEVKIVALLESTRREIVAQAFRLGARGVFSKNASVKSLGKCISCVYEGQVWATAEELGFVLEALAASPAVRPLDSVGLNQLSTREMDVVNCLAEGLSNREIAERLKLSRHTIKNYMFRIFDKLGVSSRVELLFYAFSHPATEIRSLSLAEDKTIADELTPKRSEDGQLSPGHRAVKTPVIDSKREDKTLALPHPRNGHDRQTGLLARLASA